MLNDMHQNVIQTHIGIRVLHSIAAFLDQPIVSFNGRSHWLKLLVYS